MDFNQWSAFRSRPVDTQVEISGKAVAQADSANPSRSGSPPAATDAASAARK